MQAIAPTCAHSRSKAALCLRAHHALLRAGGRLGAELLVDVFVNVGAGAGGAEGGQAGVGWEGRMGAAGWRGTARKAASMSLCMLGLCSPGGVQGDHSPTLPMVEEAEAGKGQQEGDAVSGAGSAWPQPGHLPGLARHVTAASLAPHAFKHAPPSPCELPSQRQSGLDSQRKVRALHGLVDVHALVDDQGALAAQLECDGHDALRGLPHHEAPNLGGALQNGKGWRGEVCCGC